MSDMQIGLIVLGVLFLGAVVGFNKWQERKLAKSLSARFGNARPDVLMDDGRREPQLSPAGRGRSADDDGQDAGPVAGAPAAAAMPKPPGTDEEPDAEFETVVEVSFSQPVTGEALLPYLHNLKHAGRKPVRLFATHAAGVTTLSVRPKDTYTGLRFALLLSNRSGPLTAIEYSEVVAKVQALADEFDGVTDFPEMDEVVQRAGALDQRSSAFDALVGLTLTARGEPWSAELVATAATRHGLVLLPDGRFHSVDGEGETLFVLAHPRGVSLDTTTPDSLRIDQLALVFDVPKFKEQSAPFTDMATVGQRLAEDLNADLIDDNGRPVAMAATPAVDQQIQTLYAQLREAGLPAGTVRTRRLYS